MPQIGFPMRTLLIINLKPYFFYFFFAFGINWISFYNAINQVQKIDIRNGIEIMSMFPTELAAESNT